MIISEFIDISYEDRIKMMLTNLGKSWQNFWRKLIDFIFDSDDYKS